MKLYATDGEVFTASFDAEALYDLVKAANATKVTVILKVKTLGGLRMQIHLTEIDIARSLEEAIRTDFPDLTIEEEYRAFESGPPTLEDLPVWGD